MKTMKQELQVKAKHKGMEFDLITCYEHGKFLLTSTDPDLVGWEVEVTKFLGWSTAPGYGRFENVAEIQAELKAKGF